MLEEQTKNDEKVSLALKIAMMMVDRAFASLPKPKDIDLPKMDSHTERS